MIAPREVYGFPILEPIDLMFRPASFHQSYLGQLAGRAEELPKTTVDLRVSSHGIGRQDQMWRNHDQGVASRGRSMVGCEHSQSAWIGFIVVVRGSDFDAIESNLVRLGPG